LDPRDLVAGLLDHWERSVERRVHVEQMQRFESELAARRSLVEELQSQLQAVRAGSGAPPADNDRALVERERAVAERERAVADRERELMEQRDNAAPRRGSFFRR